MSLFAISLIFFVAAAVLSAVNIWLGRNAKRLRDETAELLARSESQNRQANQILNGAIEIREQAMRNAVLNARVRHASALARRSRGDA